jgi:hypothetical protein
MVCERKSLAESEATRFDITTNALSRDDGFHSTELSRGGQMLCG